MNRTHGRLIGITAPNYVEMDIIEAIINAITFNRYYKNKFYKEHLKWQINNQESHKVLVKKFGKDYWKVHENIDN